MSEGNTIRIKDANNVCWSNQKLKFVKCDDGIVIDSVVVTLAISKKSLKELIDHIDLKTFKEWLMEE